jgi:ABC-2 type transport system permease protein
MSYFSKISGLVALQLNDRIRLFKSTNKIIFTVKMLALFVFLSTMGILLVYLVNKIPLLEVSFSLLTVVMSMFFVILFFHSLSAIITGFYFSKENELYMSLPASQNDIFLSRIITFFVKEFLINFILTFPIFVWFGVANFLGDSSILTDSISWVYFISCIVFLVLMPILTVLLSGIVSLPIIALYNLFKDKIVAKTIIVLLLLCTVCFMYFILVNSLSDTFDFSNNIGVVMFNVNNKINRAANSLHGFKSIIIQLNSWKFFYQGLPFIVLSIFLMCSILVAIVKPYYFKLAINMSTENSIKYSRGKYSKNSQFTSLVIKEYKTNFRNSNNILSYFLFILLMPFFVVLFSQMMYSMTVNAIGTNMIPGGLLLSGCIFISLSNIYAANTISLEGCNFYCMKTLPVQYSTTILSKLCFNLSLVFIAVMVTTVACIVSHSQYVLEFVIIGIIMFLFAVGNCCFNIGLDLNKPSLVWVDSNELNRLSKNTGIAIACGFALSIALGVVYMIFANKQNISVAWIVVWSIVIVYCALSIIWLVNSIKRIEKLEV